MSNSGTDAMQRLLIVLGVAAIAAGLAWPWLRKLPLGRLPGDIHVVREGFSFSFPIVTCIVISVAVSLLLWIFRR
jgi:ribose/xylose/arabinose/galactoside ABC-type transport system permease subunit